MSQHTPGPWRWYGDKGLEGPRETVLSADCGTPTCGRTRMLMSEADARLIASAPELLHVSKEALNALLDYVPQLEARGATMGYGNSVIRQLTAAITKAEGR